MVRIPPRRGPLFRCRSDVGTALASSCRSIPQWQTAAPGRTSRPPAIVSAKGGAVKAKSRPPSAGIPRPVRGRAPIDVPRATGVAQVDDGARTRGRRSRAARSVRDLGRRILPLEPVRGRCPGPITAFLAPGRLVRGATRTLARICFAQPSPRGILHIGQGQQRVVQPVWMPVIVAGRFVHVV
jgi:hypothetical protein